MTPSEQKYRNNELEALPINENAIKKNENSQCKHGKFIAATDNAGVIVLLRGTKLVTVNTRSLGVPLITSRLGFPSYGPLSPFQPSK